MMQYALHPDCRATSTGIGINDGSQVTGASSVAGNIVHAFLWDPATGMLDLNDLIPSELGWTLGIGRGINDVGQITGSGIIDGQIHAFLLTPGAVTEVPEPRTPALIAVGCIGLRLMRHRRRQYDHRTIRR